MSAVTTALVSGIADMATESLSAIGSIIPVALPIAGAVVIVTIGLRTFKKVAK